MLGGPERIRSGAAGVVVGVCGSSLCPVFSADSRADRNPTSISHISNQSVWWRVLSSGAGRSLARD